MFLYDLAPVSQTVVAVTGLATIILAATDCGKAK